MNRILIVDDKPENLHLLRTLLKGHGYEVDEARHGAEALVKARQSPPHLIISDLLMPVMDGYTLLRQWKTDGRLKQIPFVVYTAIYTEPKDERLVLNLGADAFIIKPTEHEPFMARIRAVLAAGQIGRLTPPQEPAGEGKVLLKEYSEVLIHKLEEKTLRLEQVNRALEADITARKRAEEALKLEQSLFSSLVRTIPDHVYFKDRQNRFVRINDTMTQHFGLSNPSEAIGKTDFDFFGEEHARLAYADEQRVMSTGAPIISLEEKETWPDGRITWVSTTKVALRDTDGQITGLVGISRDITERKQAEEVQKTSVAKLHGILRAAPVGIGLAVNRVLGEVNEAMGQMLGYSREELNGREGRFLYPTDEDYQSIGREYHQLAEQDKASFETRYLRKDGRIIDVAITAVRIDAANPAAGVVFTAMDITERKQAEQTRDRSLSLTRATLESTADGILVVNQAGKIEIYNRQFAVMWRLPAELLASGDDNRALQAVFDQLNEPEKFIEKVRHLYNHPLEESFDTLDFKDGRVFERFSRPQLIGGQVVGRVWSFRDITEPKRAEEKVRKLANFAELNPNPVLEFTADGTLGYRNPAALSMAQKVGFPNLTDLLPPAIHSIVAECLATGQPRLRLETLHSKHTLSWSFYPIASQQIVHCYVDDISQRLQLEEQFRQSQKMEAIGQLSGGVAHDFNNLLTVIMGNLGLMRASSKVAPEMAESMLEISRAANRAANLTRQLLAFSRQQVMQLQDLDLNEVVGSISMMLRRLLGETIEIQLGYTPRILFINADQSMLEQVILNLCINARDAMPRGGRLSLQTAAVEIDEETARQKVQARTGSFARLTVTDTGTGIAPENLGRIFEPFFTTKAVGKGTGLGLASVYGIVQQHHGWVEVQSEPGHGATFQVYLPLLVAPQARESEPVQVAEIPRGSETILLVEDDVAVQMVALIALGRLGYRVLPASTGNEALQLWQTHKAEIQLVLTDMVMPEGLSGRDIAERFKKDAPGIKIIFMSGYNAEIAGTNFPQAGGGIFLGKPFEIHTLAEAVRKCLDTPGSQ